MHPAFEVSETSSYLLYVCFSRQISSQKPLHIFLEELKRKSGYNVRNSSVDENTRSIEIEISKKTKNLKEVKSTKFSGKFISLANEKQMEQVEKRTEDFMESIMEARKENTKQRERDIRFFFELAAY